MVYQLPIDIELRIMQCIGHGGYQSQEEVLREAMDALDARDRSRLHRWNERNKLAMEQSQQGLSKPLDLDALLDRVAKRLSEVSK